MINSGWIGTADRWIFKVSSSRESDMFYPIGLGGNLKSIHLVIALLCLSGLTVAEEKPPSRTVKVVGTAEVKVVPDRAVIDVGVEKQNVSASVAKQSADAAAHRILNELRANGVDEKDIQTTFLSLRKFNDPRGKKMSYFVAKQTMSVTIRDLAKMDSIMELLIKAGANLIDSIEYETNDLRKYRDQARDLAVRAAREKAQALATALNQTIGKAVSIEEATESENRSSMYANTLYADMNAPAKSGASTAAGQKTISASVIVIFDLN